MHRGCTVWIFLNCLFLCIRGWHSCIAIRFPDVSWSSFTSSLLPLWGPFWPDCPPPTLRVLPWPALDAGVLTSSCGLPASVSVLSVASHSPNPSLVPGHFFARPAQPPTCACCLSVSRGLDLLILRRNRGQCTPAPKLPSLCVHSSVQAEVLPSSPKLPCAVLLIPSLVYMAFLSS